MISVGSIGLIKAISTYKEGRGTTLATYTARCIENEILMLLRASKKHNNVVSLSECLGQDKDGNEVCLIDIVPSPDDMQQTVENNILTEKLMLLIKRSLGEREYQIISLRYGLNNGPAYTQREVAKKLGISRSYISRLEKKALEIIKAKSKENNIYLS